MKYQYKFLIILFILIDLFLIEKIFIGNNPVSILMPHGFIALQERQLIFTAVGLMLLEVIPVFILAFYVVIHYRAHHAKKAYRPDWDHDTKLQTVIWTTPILIIAALAGITWSSAHRLDPHNALASTTKPMTIQVVALRWKWLFIYPDQRIATVNEVVFPEKTPIHFELTASDTPMNSFWIPQLGGQIYAMSGMATQTHMIADTVGEYRGSNAEISGAGFADMTFKVRSVTQTDFAKWVQTVKQAPEVLSDDTLMSLEKPNEHMPITYYSSTEDDMYSRIVMQYMAAPAKTTQHMMPGMEM